MRRLLFTLSCLTAAASAQAQIEVHDIPTRPGVTVRAVYAPAAKPVATAVLFQGGGGAIGIFANGSMRVDTGFLSGGAKRFTDNDISVLIADVPTDRRNLDSFRDSKEHAEDNAALIAFLREKAKLPVWAMGTSNGSLSAAAAAGLLKGKGPDGVVLTSSTTKAPFAGAHSVLLAPLAEIAVPVLIVHHKTDACAVTPYAAMPELKAALKAAPRVELIDADGGTNNGNPCYGGYHQFQGIEASVTKSIADWIKHYQASRP